MEDHTEDWLARFAEALDESPLSEAEIGTILDLTRDVAHGTVRRYAPLSSYLLGAAARAGSRDRGTAAVDLADRIRAILPAPDGTGTDDAGTDAAGTDDSG